MLSLITVVAALLAATPARAQDKTGDIDKIFDWVTPETPGCAVAASLNGKVVVNRAYGSADLERAVPITPATVFDAGSLRKQFVAAAVLLLAEQGRLALTDDVRKHIPAMADPGHKVTIDHLLTHTGGIRDWTGLMPLTYGDPSALTLILRQRGLNFAPGEEWSYSNSGYVLLAEIVARVSGMRFSEFARKHLFEPLGMKSSAYSEDTREIVKNRALAYDKQNGRWKLAMMLDNDRGGGAVLTTASDLLIWNDALTNNRLGAFVSEKIQEPAKLSNGRTLTYARGLFVETNRGGKSFWHTGSADGYKAWLGRFPDHGLSLAIMCNSGDEGNRTMFARRVLDLFVPPAPATPAAAAPAAPIAAAVAPAAPAAAVSKTRTPAAASPEAPIAAAAASDARTSPSAAAGAPAHAAAAPSDLNAKAGLFFADNSTEPLRLSANRNGLSIAGGPSLVTLSADRFRNPRGALSFMSQDEFELRFLSPDEFELKSMEGKTTRYRRVQPWAPSAGDLNDFAGRYTSDEIGATFRIAAAEGALRATLEHAPERSLTFRPVARDLFQLSRVTLRFQRDSGGKIVGLHYSNPVVRDVHFPRLTER